MIAAFLRMVPSSVWIGLLAAGLAIGGYFWVDHHGYARGAAEVQAKWDEARATYETALAKEKERQAQVVTRTVIEYRDRIKVVKEKGDEIVRYVEKLIPADACDLPGGFRVLHDAAAGGVGLPADPVGAAAAADPVEAAAAAATVTGNYEACLSDQARFRALQDIVKGASP